MLVERVKESENWYIIDPMHIPKFNVLQTHIQKILYLTSRQILILIKLIRLIITQKKNVTRNENIWKITNSKDVLINLFYKSKVLNKSQK